MIYTGAEPKHKIKRGQNTVIYAVSYKNTKDELKGAGKKFSLQVPGSLPNLLSLPWVCNIVHAFL
jgi:hypothetical protein